MEQLPVQRRHHLQPWDLIEQRSGIRYERNRRLPTFGYQPKDTPKGASAVSDWTQLVQDPTSMWSSETMGGTGESLNFCRVH